MLKYLSLSLLCLSYRFLLCGYHEAYIKHLIIVCFKLITILSLYASFSILL